MMNRLDIVRAWKDEEYRNSLAEGERAALPQNPAGYVQLNAAGLEGAAGGDKNGGVPHTYSTLCQLNTLRTPVFACPPPTFHGRICPPMSLPPRCPVRTARIFCPPPIPL